MPPPSFGEIPTPASTLTMTFRVPANVIGGTYPNDPYGTTVPMAVSRFGIENDTLGRGAAGVLLVSSVLV